MGIIRGTDLKKHSFKSIDLGPRWTAHFGAIATEGSITVWGDSGQGKTSYCLQLLKALCQQSVRCLYVSMEEGYSLSSQRACMREGVIDNRYFYVSDERNLEGLKTLLCSQRAPKAIVIDSIQYGGFNYDDYKRFTQEHPDKLFIFVSHLGSGREPDGATAINIKYNSNVKVFVEGFEAFATSRFGGGEPYVISEAKVKKQKL